MARYKVIDTHPKLIAVDLARQLLPGTFEHALDHLLEHEVDLSGLDARYRNDATGAPAYAPAVLLKLILFAYSRGIVSSRAIERACHEHVTFIALCGDQAPHFTTIAAFICDLGNDIAELFAQVLFICDVQGLIGREMFAIDGVKLSSNAAKGRSGTRAEFERQAAKLEAQARKMLERHRTTDEREDRRNPEPELAAKAQQRIERLSRDAAQIRQWLHHHPEDRRGSKGSVRKSNRTDNDSAKMATDKGVIQGYTGVAAVDGQHQVIVEAQAHGTGSEQALLIPVLDAMQDLLQENSVVTADAGYHSEANLAALAEHNVPALIADKGMRQRDERFAEQGKYQGQPDPLYDKSRPHKKIATYGPTDFDFDPDTHTCICPAGKRLYGAGSHCTINGYAVIKFRGALRDCVPCSQRTRCLRSPEKTKTRQVAFFQGKVKHAPPTCSERMKRAIDSPRGRALYGQRIGIVEPVFANLRHNKRLDRFTLRGQRKVDTQWKLYCMVHNIEKLAHHGYAQ